MRAAACTTLARVAFVALCGTAVLAQAAEPVETISARRRTTAGEPVLVRTHARWDGNCKASTLPTITWLVNPEHGKVEQKTDEVIAGGNVVGGTNCEGIPMRGLRLTYIPEPGFRGVESLSYDVRYDAKQPIIRYEFRVTVE